MAKNNTQDTIKDLIGDIADSTKKAFDEILDRKGDDHDSGDWCNPGQSYQALNGLSADVLRTVSALSALGGVANPVAGANPLAALAGGANPLAAIGSGAAAANPLAALTGAVGGANPLGALGQVAGGAASVVSGAAEAAEGLAALPRQIAQLTELIASLASVLENVQHVTGAVTGAARKTT